MNIAEIHNRGQLADGGPVYHETDLERFVVEPWNAYSSLSFLVPAIIFLVILRGKYSEHKFLVFLAIPLLILGGSGSTLYHAFRASRLMLALDVLPIILLTLSVSIYFLYEVIKNWLVVAAIILGSFGLRFLLWGEFQGQTAINIGYAITGVMIFVPALLYVIRSGYIHFRHLAFSIIAFILALFFRYMDDLREPLLWMGTHWLWHIACAVGAFFLGMYLFRTRETIKLQELRAE